MASFVAFPSLPAELRLKIWEAALPAPRIVDINLSISRTRITTVLSPPNILYVCLESRAVALRHHRRLFTTSKHSGIYIDPSHDTILLRPLCAASCYQQRRCFECFHFDYYSRLRRYGEDSMKWVENVAIYDFGLAGLASAWALFPRMRRLVGVVLVDDPRQELTRVEHPLKETLEKLLRGAKDGFPATLADLEVPEVVIVRAEDLGLERA